MAVVKGTMLTIGTGGAFADDTTADYPSINDVQEGVEFAYTVLTGVFVSPAVDNVLLAIEYGASAEYTGTLNTTRSYEHGPSAIELPASFRGSGTYGDDQAVIEAKFDALILAIERLYQVTQHKANYEA